MDIYDACKELEKDILNNSYYDSPMLIQLFCSYINDGDTPKMALSAARSDLTYSPENTQQ